MDDQNTTENKTSFWQNDKLLVCSMLSFYGICIVGLAAAAFFWINQKQAAINADSTSTAVAIVTQQANATATVVAKRMEQDQFMYVDHFDNNSKYWYVGPYYSDPNSTQPDTRATIKDGVYIWEIDNSSSYTKSVEFFREEKLKNFDAYIDIKFVTSSPSEGICTGLFFRKQANDWNSGAYTFTICNNSSFSVLYYKNFEWATIAYSEYESAIHRNDWNRIEISARGNYFVFTINGEEVSNMMDYRSKEGRIGIEIDSPEKGSAEIWFDNFGLQPR